MRIGVLCPDWNWLFLEPFLEDWTKSGLGDVYRFKTRPSDGAFPRKWLDQLNIASDVIFVEWALPHLVTLTHRKNLKPIIVRILGYDAALPHLEVVDWSKVSKIIIVSEHLRKAFLGSFRNINPDETTVLENGIDVDLFKPPTERFFERIAGTTANFTPNKGLTDMMNVIGRQKGWKMKFLMNTGQGSPSSPTYQEMIRKYIARRPQLFEELPKRQYKDMPDYYQNLSVYINMSQHETSGVSIFEAMACGCFPIIKNWIGASDEFPSKYLIQNVGEAVRKLRWWDNLSGEDKMKESLECREHAVKRFNLKDRFPIMRKFLQEVCDERK